MASVYVDREISMAEAAAPLAIVVICADVFRLGVIEEPINASTCVDAGAFVG